MVEERWIVDRLEGEVVLLERSGGTLSLPRALLPAALREGDVLVVGVEVRTEGAAWRLAIDREATAARGRELAALRARLGGGDPGGDIEL